MKKLFICKQCGKEYYSFKESSNFCCMECKKDYYRLIPHECDYCGKEHYIKRYEYEHLVENPEKKMYCSRECANLALHNSVTKICDYCGSEYTVFKSLEKTQKFCSYECFRKEKAKMIKQRTVICENCGKEFKTYHPNQKFCCYECSNENQMNRVICECEYCGKEFERIVSEVDKNKHHYCSNECRINSVKWNSHDIEVLRTYYGKISNDEIIPLLDTVRTSGAIKGKANSLGFVAYNLWTQPEEEIMKQFYSNMELSDIQKLLPNRTPIQIQAKGRTMGILSYSYLNKIYSKDELEFLENNYLSLSNSELAMKLGRSENAIAQRLFLMDLYRPHEVKKSGYTKLQGFVRSRLQSWKEMYKRKCDYTCCITGSKGSIAVHHCRSFNILFQETIDLLDFQLKDDFESYTDDELEQFYSSFFDLQEMYGEYVCVSEHLHLLFHKIFGYGDNTIEQWNEFVMTYDNYITF